MCLRGWLRVGTHFFLLLGACENLVPVVMSGHTQFLGDITKLGYNGYDMVKLDHMSGKKLRTKLTSTILKNLIFYRTYIYWKYNIYNI